MLGFESSELRTISIHAPVKGATVARQAWCPQGLISIHAPVKGATGDRLDKRIGGYDFNPRSREGSDDKQLAALDKASEFQSTLP